MIQGIRLTNTEKIQLQQTLAEVNEQLAARSLPQLTPSALIHIIIDQSLNRLQVSPQGDITILK